MFSIIKINFKYPKRFKLNLFFKLFNSKSQFDISSHINIDRIQIMQIQ